LTPSPSVPKGLILARGFRYYGKKRGHRRTGSPLWGGVGEIAFYTAFLILGCGFSAWMIFGVVVPEWRVNHEFVESTCKVLEREIYEKRGEDGTLYGLKLKIEYPAAGDFSTLTNYDIRKTCYSDRERAKAIYDQFEVFNTKRNNRYPCWYDPADVSTVVLTRAYRWRDWLFFMIPIPFIVIGAGGLIYNGLRWGKSAERRAARIRRAAKREYIRAGDERRRFPCVPEGTDITNSPGTKLKFRLPIARSPGWALFGAMAFCIVWNGIVAVLLVLAVRGRLAGKSGWLPTLFIVPFALIGIGALVYFFRQLFMTTGIGPTRLEISDHPLRPGGEYRLFLSQSGRLRVNSLGASLTCKEVATYRQGTDTRTETREVFRQELFRRETFEIQSDLPFETDLALTVPPGAMHSFAADHNKIQWALVVEGDAAGWPEFRRAFPVIVQSDGGETTQ
jgi:hypothetical protein